MEEISFSEDFYLCNSETYIILEKILEYNIYHYNVFYWVGSQSPLIKRKITAESVALLQDHLEKIQNSKLIFFGREMEGYESEKFCYLIGLSERPEVLNLYYVQGLGGYLISLPPIPCNVFYTTDTYVLHKGSEIVIWIGEEALPEKIKVAGILAERIVKVDLQKQDEEIEKYISFIDDLQMKKDNKKFYENFLQHISKLKRNYYPSEPCWLYDSIIWKYLNEAVKVYVFFLAHDNSVQIRELTKRPFYLSLFKKNITIVRQGELLLTNFIIHFWDEMKKLLPLEDLNNFNDSMINKIKISEAT